MSSPLDPYTDPNTGFLRNKLGITDSDELDRAEVFWTAALHRIGLTTTETPAVTTTSATTPAPPTAEVRAWARANGMAVPDRGRLRPEIHQAWRDAHPG